MTSTVTVLEGLRDAGVDVADDPAGYAVAGAAPECVALPSSVDEVRSVLEVARASGRAVVPLGRGTEPGCVPPARAFVVLATERLAGVEAYEPADLTLTAGAGTPLAELVAATATHRQWLPFDPPRLEHRSLGGLVGSGTSGALSIALGAVRDHVLGVTVVTGDGRLLRLGGRVMKNVAGFDLVRAAVGSRGALGVVVSATVRLFPVPEAEHVSVARAASFEALLPLARRVRTASVVPAGALLVVRPDSAELLVRVMGATSAVPHDRDALVGDRRGNEELDGAPARGAFDRACDAAEGRAVTLRAAARASELADVLTGLARALPGATLVADVMTGRVRAGADPVGHEALASLRGSLEARDGTLLLERAPTDLAEALGEGRFRGGVSIEDALRASFDPHGTLDRRRPA